MITAVIGRQFLAAYNAAHDLQLSVAEYFEDRFIPLFFDHPKYLMPGGNSRLNQPPISSDKLLDKPDRTRRISELLRFIRTDPASSSPVGFPSTDVLATTSGQVSGASMQVSSDEAMLSWIGGALGIGVQGRLSLLIPVAEVLLAIEKGWHLYRQLHNTRTELRPNQVNTWNGQWLAHYANALNDAEDILLKADVYSTDKGIMSVETASWIDVLLAFMKLLPASVYTQVVYVYNLDKTNTTIGFVPVDIAGVERPFQLYQKLFGKGEFTENYTFIRELFGSGFGFRRACQAGAIGTYALQPKGLHGLMPYLGGGKEGKMPKLDKSNITQLVSFHTYQTWLLAMLKNDDLWTESEKAAKLLLAYEAGAGKLRKNRDANVQEVLKAANKRKFQAAMEPVVTESSPPAEAIDLCHTVHQLPEDNFQYFLTLVRLRYAEFAR